MLTKKEQLFNHFLEGFGLPEWSVTSPGRANIIGEHVDYCEGLVLPFAIKQSMYFLAKKRGDNNIVIDAFDLSETVVLTKNENIEAPIWSQYFIKILNCLKEYYEKDFGLDISFGSEIPLGGGVSSSSALCCGFLFLLDKMYDLKLSKKTIIELASKAEYGMGLKGGKMDQTAIVYGEEGKAVLLDCKSEEHEYVDLNLGSYEFVLFDTNVKHALIDSDYNKRRYEVESALKLICEEQKQSRSFSGLNVNDVIFLKETNMRLYKRISHVINEVARVRKSVHAIKRQDFPLLGEYLNESHESLKEDYEVSCPELNYVADQLRSLPSVLGARMMGGGFGGNVIALLKTPKDLTVFNKLKSNYKKCFGIDLIIMKVSPSNGLTYHSYE